MYIGGIFLMTFIGCLIQFHIRQHPKDIKEDLIKTEHPQENSEKHPEIINLHNKNVNN